MKIKSDFYQNHDTEQIARNLLGKFLITNFNGTITSGMIVETEAYCGILDKASHAYNGRRTRRTEIMYREGGTAYVYLIYGIYALFNVVTGKVNFPHAILIRALQPAEGIDAMLTRRKMSRIQYNLCNGPGLLTLALDITTQHSGLSLLDDLIWLEDRNIKITDNNIIAGPRVGVAYAGEDALLHRRFRLGDNPWVSRAK
jgi:DNA-3-methyladenine glycosylase